MNATPSAGVRPLYFVAVMAAGAVPCSTHRTIAALMYRTKRGKHLPLFAEARLRLGGRVASTAICGVYYFNRKVALAMVRSAVRLAISEGTVVTKATLRAASLLAISNRALARIVGVSEATVSRMGSGTYTLRPDEKPFELAVLFIRFYRALDAIVHADDAPDHRGDREHAAA